MPRIVARLSASGKEIKIREWVAGMMRVVEDLHARTSRLPSFERKMCIKEFLEGCLERRSADLDDVFEMRSNMLREALLDEEEQEKENLAQERHIRRLIADVENMKDEPWIVRYDKGMVEDYVLFLLSGGQRIYREKVVRYFET